MTRDGRCPFPVAIVTEIQDDGSPVFRQSVYQFSIRHIDSFFNFLVGQMQNDVEYREGEIGLSAAIRTIYDALCLNAALNHLLIK